MSIIGPVESIGILHTPYATPADMPIQSAESGNVQGTAIIHVRWRQGLADLAGFERVWLLWWADRALPGTPLVRPFRDDRERGVFATRSPTRPNPIGMSCVRLLAVEDDRFAFAGVDMLDGTPLIDIKPYVWRWDAFPGIRSGWYDAAGRPTAQSDGRFTPSF